MPELCAHPRPIRYLGRNLNNLLARSNGVNEMLVQELLTVASFETAPDAWIFRNRLVSNGIDAFVADEHTVNMYWLYSNAVGGVKVQVPLRQLGLFRELELQRIPPESELAMHAADSALDDFGIEVCQRCGSSEITDSTWSKPWTFVLWLIFGFPIPVYAPTTSCNACGYRIPAQFKLPTQFRIIHILILTTIVAFLLGILNYADIDWQNFSTVQTPWAAPK